MIWQWMNPFLVSKKSGGWNLRKNLWIPSSVEQVSWWTKMKIKSINTMVGVSCSQRDRLTRTVAKYKMHHHSYQQQQELTKPKQHVKRTSLTQQRLTRPGTSSLTFGHQDDPGTRIRIFCWPLREEVFFLPLL